MMGGVQSDGSRRVFQPLACQVCSGSREPDSSDKELAEVLQLLLCVTGRARSAPLPTGRGRGSRFPAGRLLTPTRLSWLMKFEDRRHQRKTVPARRGRWRVKRLYTRPGVSRILWRTGVLIPASCAACRNRLLSAGGVSFLLRFKAISCKPHIVLCDICLKTTSYLQNVSSFASLPLRRSNMRSVLITIDLIKHRISKWIIKMKRKLHLEAHNVTDSPVRTALNEKNKNIEILQRLKQT